MNRRAFSFMAAASLAACNGGTGSPVLSATVPLSSQPFIDSMGRLADAWNAGNADAWAAEYWPDGSLVNILGVYFTSSAAIATVTGQILSGPFKGSTFATAIRDVRFVGNVGAIVDVDVSVTNYKFLPPGAVPTAPNLLLTRFIFIFEKRAGVWKIEASQNTAVLPSAVPSPSPSPT